ncbi:MAG: hypothetical protein ABDH29_04170 [Aquificaceae bacterium]
MLAIFSLPEAYLHSYKNFSDLIADFVLHPDDIMHIISNPSYIPEIISSSLPLSVHTQMNSVDMEILAKIAGDYKFINKTFLVTESPHKRFPKAIAYIMSPEEKYLSFTCNISPNLPVELHNVKFDRAAPSTSFRLDERSFIAYCTKNGWKEAHIKGEVDDKLVETFLYHLSLEGQANIEWLTEDIKEFTAKLNIYDRISVAQGEKELVLYGFLRRL